MSSMTQANMIPVRYVGKMLHWRDTNYGSNVGFTRGKVSLVPDWAAVRLLAHPEFEDGRPAKARTAIVAGERPRDEREEELDELARIDQGVRLQLMSDAQKTHFAMRAFGVRIETNNPELDVTSAVRHLVRQRGV